jgi:hypothetical protein
MKDNSAVIGHCLRQSKSLKFIVGPNYSNGTISPQANSITKATLISSWLDSYFPDMVYQGQ